MKKWNMVIDVARCHDCNDCFLADKDEFVGNDFPPYSVAQPWTGHRWLNIDRKERGQYPIVRVAYLPRPCMQCANAACLREAPSGTIYRREDGLVIIDPEKAKGHPELVDLCPYGSIYWNEEADVAQKCTGCAHLLDAGWTETRCSQICPTGAIRLVLADDDEMEALAAAENLEALRADLGTQPRVLYKNLHRWNKCFVAANVAYKDTDECAEGVEVTVTAEDSVTARALTDNYGEFLVDGLEPDREYDVTVSIPGYEAYSLSLVLETSRNMGLILLERS